MAKNKLMRFRQNAENDLIIEPGKEIFENIKGKWRTFFGNEKPITIEMGCGRGEYTIGLASVFPERNFIGIDIKGARIWKGGCEAKENNLKNAVFLRAQIMLIRGFFEKNEADEIWITFPDPRPKESHEKHRLSGPYFLRTYKDFLKEGGFVHLKTDSISLFKYTLETLEQAKPGNKMYPYYITDLEYTYDLYDSDLIKDHHGIQTTYERRFLADGLKINYLRFRLYNNPEFMIKEN